MQYPTPSRIQLIEVNVINFRLASTAFLGRRPHCFNFFKEQRKDAHTEKNKGMVCTGKRLTKLTMRTAEQQNRPYHGFDRHFDG